MIDQLELSEWKGQQLADQGMARCASKSSAWLQKAEEVLREHRPGCYPADSLRESVVKEIGEPHHPNVWGSLFRGCCNRGILTNTGQTMKSRIVQSHSRRVTIYKIGGVPC